MIGSGGGDSQLLWSLRALGSECEKEATGLHFPWNVKRRKELTIPQGRDDAYAKNQAKKCKEPLYA